MQEEYINEVALMLKVRQGDENAFEILHGRYQTRMLNFFYGMSRNVHTATDLCQETFLRVWKVRKRYKATGSFPAYLFGIARMIWLEKCRDWGRMQRLGLRASPDDLLDLADERGPGPAELASQSELRQHIQQALEQLPEDQRIVFVLRNIEGLSLEDIAAALDCPVNTVRSRKILAVKKLRYLLSSVFISRPKLGPVGARESCYAENIEAGSPPM